MSTRFWKENFDEDLAVYALVMGLRRPFGTGLSTSSMKSDDAGPAPFLIPGIRKERGIVTYCFHLRGHGDGGAMM
jgi:hypothetical protein